MNELDKNAPQKLFDEIKQIIDKSRSLISSTANSTLSATYWHIGKKIKTDLLKNKRAEYGKQVIENLSIRLTQEYGRGWSKQQLQHCLRFAETFSDYTHNR